MIRLSPYRLLPDRAPPVTSVIFAVTGLLLEQGRCRSEQRHVATCLAGARADSAVREAWGAGLASGSFVPSRNRNLRKDIVTALGRARQAGCETPLLAAAAALFEE